MSADFIFGQMRSCIQKPIDSQLHVVDRMNSLSTQSKRNRDLRAAFFTSKLWPKNSTINFAFIEEPKNVPWTSIDKLETSADGKKTDVDPIEYEIRKMNPKEAVKYVVAKRVQPLVGLKLVFVDDYTQADVRIGFDIYDGAWALVGTQCLSDDPDVKGKPTMNLGWFDVATTMHEFFHVLGLIHEHQNSKDNPIDWDKNAVYQWAQSTQNWDKQTTDQNILQPYPANQINGSIFDPLSIMLYFFPASLTTNQQGTRQNLRLSGYDVKYVSEKYPGGEMTPEDFYLKTYNQTLQDNINESTKDLQSKFPILNNNMLYITSLLVLYISFKL